ncbi:hypothetical protein ACSFA2_22325 [Variovorax sp. LT2P21]|uniref:hypothetical protein n=1 Tax=Variovorax sp. LT2P21 TaxID=3443731 RepID=UPI003F476B60
MKTNTYSSGDQSEGLSPDEIKTEVTPSKCSSILGEIGGALLSLPPNTASESQTWGYIKDPYDLLGSDGKPRFRMEQIRFTIVRAKLENGGVRCYMTISWLVSSFGWTTQYGNTPGINFDVNVKNEAGGVLVPWRFSTHFTCGLNKSSVVFLKDFDPQVYDIIDGAPMIVNGFRMYGC